MINLKHNDKLTFIINMHLDFGEALTGGIMACHYLAYKLAERGHYVYMFANPEYPHENIYRIPSSKTRNDGFLTFTWEEMRFDPDKTVVIYTEIDRGNPFGIKNVTRWLLYHSSEEIESGWGENDQVFNYMSFNTVNKDTTGTLTVVDFHLEDLKDLHNTRSGFCHTLHKDTPHNYQEILDVFQSQDLGEWKSAGAYTYLRNFFNKYKYFLTFDNNTFYAVAASLCGCTSIILNDTKYNSPEEFREKNKVFKYGVAYGMKDIDWAISTKHLVLQHLLDVQREYDKTVDSFIQFWNNKLNIC
jgi:hypothetical protein